LIDVLIEAGDGKIYSLAEAQAVRLAENMRSKPRDRDSYIPAADKLETALVDGEWAAPVRFTEAEAASAARALEANIVGDPDNTRLRRLQWALLDD
jgi:hypothetical protein